MLYHIHSPTILHLSKFEQTPSSHLDQPQKQMDYQKNSSSCSYNSVYTHEKWETMVRASDNEEALMTGLRKGPWTEEEDSKLTSAVATHGVGRWNELANIAGLRRSGKSCRLRWLNYLRPDLRRGGFTLEEQLVILELHLRWGNRWSKIAENLPRRTDNEIKNYWRTKVPKLARQFKCNVNSLEFKDTLRNIWIPRLAEQIRANGSPTSNTTKPQNEGPSTECGVGPENTFSSSNSSSEDCLFDTTASWAQTSLDQHVAGPVDLITEPNNLTHSCEAHISPESGSSVELDPYWEQNLNDFLWDMTLYDENNIIYDGNDILFLQQQLDYLDM